MSVGKASIKRAVNAGKAAAKAETAEVREEVKVQEPEQEVKAEAAAEVKPAEQEKKTPAKKTAATKKPTAEKKTTRTRKAPAKKADEAAKQEPQVKFIADESPEQENPNRPVHITEEMPIYLL